MEKIENFLEMYPWFLPLMIVVIIWDTVLTMIALWKSARNNHLVWFVCLAVLNSIGVLPIIYLLINRNNKITNE